MAATATLQFVFELREGTATQLIAASVVVSKSGSLTNGVAVAVKSADVGGLSPVKLLSSTVND